MPPHARRAMCSTVHTFWLGADWGLQSDGMPDLPLQAAMIDRYVAMYGEAMRNSTAQLLPGRGGSSKAAAGKPKKRVPDGLFLPSCFQHPLSFSEQITPPPGSSGAAAAPQSWQLLAGDWFFELNQFQQFHYLVERCPTDLPCNTDPVCKYTGSFPGPSPGPPPPPPGGRCAAQFAKDGCSGLPKQTCDGCVHKHQLDLRLAGCKSGEARALCPV